MRPVSFTTARRIAVQTAEHLVPSPLTAHVARETSGKCLQLLVEYRPDCDSPVVPSVVTESVLLVYEGLTVERFEALCRRSWKSLVTAMRVHVTASDRRDVASVHTKRHASVAKRLR